MKIQIKAAARLRATETLADLEEVPTSGAQASKDFKSPEVLKRAGIDKKRLSTPSAKAALDKLVTESSIANMLKSPAAKSSAVSMSLIGSLAGATMNPQSLKKAKDASAKILKAYNSYMEAVSKGSAGGSQAADRAKAAKQTYVDAVKEASTNLGFALGFPMNKLSTTEITMLAKGIDFVK